MRALATFKRASKAVSGGGTIAGRSVPPLARLWSIGRGRGCTATAEEAQGEAGMGPFGTKTNTRGGR